MRKKIFATLLTAVTLLTTLPMNVFAANETFEPEDGDKVTVVASAVVTEDELVALGLDLTISIPTEISLSLNGTTFEGSGEIYAYGVMDKEKVLRVNIDETHEDYHAIYFHETREITVQPFCQIQTLMELWRNPWITHPLFIPIYHRTILTC